jgi:hypothetical protein
MARRRTAMVRFSSWSWRMFEPSCKGRLSEVLLNSFVSWK